MHEEEFMRLSSDVVKSHFGDTIDFGPCVVGRILNLLTIRGYGSLDQLACISAPDVYDMKKNQSGTQRALKSGHAEGCYEYAMDSLQALAEEYPRAFPEVILNARDENAVTVYNLDDPEEEIELDSFSDPTDPPVVGVRVDLSAIEFPKPKFPPQISRVDGNHRLTKTDQILGDLSEGKIEEEEVPDEFPVIGFSLLVGLTPIQEARLFRDINGEHEGMETAHLDTIMVRISNVEELRDDENKRPLWIAHELVQPGMAFEGMVFMGGSTKGVKEEGTVPPIKINSLKSTINQQLKSAEKATALLKDEPEVLLSLIDSYWKAVASTFPEAWDDKKGYILMQSIGLGAFARLGGDLMDTAIELEEGEEEDFARHLEPVKSSISLERDQWKGIAGAGGQKVVFDALINATESEKAKALKLKQKVLGGSPTIADKLGTNGDESAADEGAEEGVEEEK